MNDGKERDHVVTVAKLRLELGSKLGESHKDSKMLSPCWEECKMVQSLKFGSSSES